MPHPAIRGRLRSLMLRRLLAFLTRPSCVPVWHWFDYLVLFVGVGLLAYLIGWFWPGELEIVPLPW